MKKKQQHKTIQSILSLTKCIRYYKVQQVYYKVSQVLQSVTVVTKCDVTPFSLKTSNKMFEKVRLFRF